MIAILYVSQALAAPQDRSRVLDDIETVSIARNSMLDITGLLVASPQHFTGLLEGPKRNVVAVVDSIRADSRHINLRIVRQLAIVKPYCRSWRLTRFDTENFGNNNITPLLTAVHAGVDADALRRLERLIAAITAT